ncbi:hypothetical protein BDB01DRAFT_806854 [Pilobolus umbonatus]|nr:hypothetical protein BDB01DRAFT_806854 [Pilobolus umbonatus]
MTQYYPNKGRMTRDEIMAMARYEYARQLSVYTRDLLSKGRGLGKAQVMTMKTRVNSHEQ